MKKRILFFVSELPTFNGTGIHRVAKAIFNSLKKNPPIGYEVLAIYGDPKGAFYCSNLFDTAYSNENDLENKCQIKPHSGDIFLSVDLVYTLTKEICNELDRFKRAGVGIYFVLYDLIPLRYPEWFSGESLHLERNIYLDQFTYWFNAVSSHADGLLCISKTVETDVSNWFIEYPSSVSDLPKLGSFHLGFDIDASNPSSGLHDNASSIINSLKSSVAFIMVGTLEPRKGQSLALDAFEYLWDKGYSAKLVIIGRVGKPWRSKQADDLINRIKTHSRLGNQLLWLEGISDEYLREIYKFSTALLMLSEAEGFGLPLVEAAHYEVPIIARDIPVFREICGDNAIYFKSGSGVDLGLLIEDWLERFKLGTLPESGKIHPLTWHESTKQLMKVVGDMSGISFNWEADE